MNRTSWIIISLVCVIGLGSLIFLTKKDQVDVNSINPSSIINAQGDTLGDNVAGNKEAKVVLIEYADFQCGGCAAAHRNTLKIQELYKDKVAFVFRNFPITSGHPNALAAATVAEAAGLQGKYWEMNDALFEAQSSWSPLTIEQRGPAFRGLAEKIGLNLEEFDAALTDSRIQQKIKVDRALASRVGVTGTPSFFLGDQKLSDAIVTDVMQKDGKLMMDVLDEALKSAGETPPARQ